MRGIAREHYGLDLGDVTWYVDDTEDVAIDIPENFDVRHLPEGADMEGIFVAGDVDGAFYPVLLDSVTDPESGAERIFPNYAAEEADYYRETDIFPVMHTVAICDDLIERHLWVAVNLFGHSSRPVTTCWAALLTCGPRRRCGSATALSGSSRSSGPQPGSTAPRRATWLP